MFADLDDENGYHVSYRPHVVVKGTVLADIDDEKLYHVSYRTHVVVNLNR